VKLRSLARWVPAHPRSGKTARRSWFLALARHPGRLAASPSECVSLRALGVLLKICNTNTPSSHRSDLCMLCFFSASASASAGACAPSLSSCRVAGPFCCFCLGHLCIPKSIPRPKISGPDWLWQAVLAASPHQVGRRLEGHPVTNRDKNWTPTAALSGKQGGAQSTPIFQRTDHDRILRYISCLERERLPLGHGDPCFDLRVRLVCSEAAARYAGRSINTSSGSITLRNATSNGSSLHRRDRRKQVLRDRRSNPILGHTINVQEILANSYSSNVGNHPKMASQTASAGMQ